LDLSQYGGQVLTPDRLSLLQSSILLYGPPGTGKTTFLGTVQDVPELCPMLIIDTEGSTSALGDQYDPTKIHIVRYDSYNPRLAKLLEDLLNKKHPFKTVAIDTLAGLQQLMIRKASEVNQDRGKTNNALNLGTPTEADWGAIGTAMNRVLDAFSKAPFLLITTAHEVADGGVLRPGIQGKMTPNDLPGRPAVVMYTKVVPPKAPGNPSDSPMYVGVTGYSLENGRTTIAKDRTGKLPLGIKNPTLSELIRYTSAK